MPSRPADLDWILITRFKPEPIGAIGFIGSDIVAVAAFHDDRDANQDGKVSALEWAVSALSPISVEGTAVLEVAMAARGDLSVIERDPSIMRISAQMLVSTFRGMILDGVYAAYFARGVKMGGAGIAKRVTSGMVREFVVRKGFEKAVKEAFMAAADR